jgi:hypothetical protein
MEGCKVCQAVIDVEANMRLNCYKNKVRDAIEPYVLAGAYPSIFKEIIEKLGL